MKLKRFTAPDTRAAMQQIKAAFGPDAVILSSSTVEGGVEIVAAVDFDASVLSANAAVASAEPPSKAAAPTPAAFPLEDMRQEIHTLRGMLEAQMRGHMGYGAPLHTVLMQKLLRLGVSEKTSSSLVDCIGSDLNQQKGWQQVLDNFASKTPIYAGRRIEEGGIYAFVGPTGVGKTTSLAKIAARFVLRFGADKLGLVTMDNYRIAAEEQLVLYGKILGVPVSVAQDEVSLNRVIKQLNTKKLILIDTAGMNPADARVSQQMDLLNGQLQSISTVLVLPATNHYQSLVDAIERYQVRRIEQCIITKLDESAAIGGILSAISETGLGVSYLTHGQRVPEDIKMATRHQLIEQLTMQEQQQSERAGGAYVES